MFFCFPQYIFNPETSEWKQRGHQVFQGRRWLGSINYTTGKLAHPKLNVKKTKGRLPIDYKVQSRPKYLGHPFAIILLIIVVIIRLMRMFPPCWVFKAQNMLQLTFPVLHFPPDNKHSLLRPLSPRSMLMGAPKTVQ